MNEPVEHGSGYLTDQKICRGVHESVRSLDADIRDGIDAWTENRRPLRLDEDGRGDPQLSGRIYN